jgi:uncharacterized membrane protein (DUF373 family)
MEEEEPDLGGPSVPAWVARVLGSFEIVLYLSAAALLAIAAGFVVVGTIVRLVDDVGNTSAIDIAVLVLDRVLLALIVGELLYTLRFVLRTHEIVVTPFLFIGLIAVVRRILIVTAQLEQGGLHGRALTNVLLELGILGLLAPALASAVFLVRRSRRAPAQ